MVDEATLLIVISTVAQTVVLSITLIVFVLQFRSQEEAIKESSYQNLIGRYNDLASKLIDEPGLTLSLFSVGGRPPEATKNATKEDAMVYSYLLLVYGLVEEAYLLYEKKWISEDDWQQWSAFLEKMSRHPMFSTVHEMVSGTFDKRFEEYVRDKILAKGNGELAAGKRTAL